MKTNEKILGFPCIQRQFNSYVYVYMYVYVHVYVHERTSIKTDGIERSFLIEFIAGVIQATFCVNPRLKRGIAM